MKKMNVRIRVASLVLLAALTLEAPVWAQHPNVARGFTPSGLFDVGGIDTVNAFNGNLAIRIPIGGSYPVGGTMGSYSFALTYNSNVWNHLSRDGVVGSAGGGAGTQVTSVYAVPDPFANAGLGWSFSLGRIGSFAGGETSNGWHLKAPLPQGENTFHAADGGEHALFTSMSAPGGGVSDGHWFSNDGSHLRYEPNARILELPDGTVESFNPDGYPTSIRDRFGNGLTITYNYDFPSVPAIPSKWTINDGARTHVVTFRLTGFEFPLQRAVVDSIQLAKPGGGLATWKLRYNGEDAFGNGFQAVGLTGFGTQRRISGEPIWNPNVYVLTSILLPDGTRYSMPLASILQNNEMCDGVGPCSGPIQRLELPTGGALEWDYHIRPMPQPRIDDDHQWLIPTWSFSVQVTKRRLYDEHGLLGEWTYGAPDSDLNVAFRWNELVRQVTYPPAEPGRAGVRVISYYSSCVFGVCINEAGAPDGQNNTFASDYGLPFSRRRPDDGAGRFLSQEYYPAGSSTPVRRVYLRYENDFPPGTSFDTTFGMPQINQRQQSQRTVYLDDLLPANQGFASVVVDSSDYDGLGHYREVTTSDNFGFGTTRTERTHWNPNGRPAAAQPWLLNLFDFQEQQEGSSLARQEFLFEAGTGFLPCKRVLKDGRSRGAFDVLVSYEHTRADLPGSMTLEKWFGGDHQDLGGSGCAALPAAPVYVYNHDYTAGGHSKTTVQADALLKVLDLDVDAPSGLAQASRDVSSRPTAYTYDVLGRLTSSTPQGDAATVIDYGLPNVPIVVDLKVGSGAPLEERKWTLDGLGRIVRDEISLPAGGRSVSVVAYNALGWKLFESERSANPPSTIDLVSRCLQPASGTAYCNFDAFGRAGTMMTADGKATLLEYQGVRTVKRSQRVWDGTKEVLATTREEYDGLGRLRRIREPNGTWTRYSYDVGGRLATVTADAGAAKTQIRSFQYDGRGFLVREVQPESGATNYKYDAKGNVTHKITPTGTILQEYDSAGRLTQVSTPQAPLRLLSYVPSGASLGKLSSARAFNDRLVGPSCLRFEVRQDFAYNPTHGRLESEQTSLFQGGTPLEKWSQGYGYDGAGRVTQLTYPFCLASCAAAARAQTITYDMGRTTAVPGVATSITYNENGLLKTINHSNGVVFSQSSDASGMARPGSLSTNRDWHVETYSYDGSGNIKQIGGKRFTYDDDSRLTSALLPGISTPYREYTYDVFGNLIQVGQGAAAGNATTFVNYTPDPATNRLQSATYDASGNLLAFQGSTYTWDVLGQVTAVNTGSEQWVHTYDATGERAWSWRTAPTRTDTYALRGLGNKVLSAFTKIGANYTWEDYVYRDDQLLAAKFSDGKLVHLDLDHLGSVRQETDASGAVLKYRDFWPYGEEATAPSGTERMKFAGHERDLGDPSSIADDLDYMHARYYRPLTGRFLNVDPAGGNPKMPQSWNRYSYVAGNPLKYVDPSGKTIDCSASPATRKYCAEFSEQPQTFWQWVKKAYREASMLPGPMALEMAPEVVGEVAASAGPGLLTRIGQFFKSFTLRNFRENLARLTGEIPESAQAHHVFPVKFADRFQELGINVNDPHFGSWWETADHLAKAYQYNARWQQFLRTGPSAEQATEFARQLATEYGFQIGF